MKKLLVKLGRQLIVWGGEQDLLDQNKMQRRVIGALQQGSSHQYGHYDLEVDEDVHTGKLAMRINYFMPSETSMVMFLDAFAKTIHQETIQLFENLQQRIRLNKALIAEAEEWVPPSSLGEKETEYKHAICAPPDD